MMMNIIIDQLVNNVTCHLSPHHQGTDNEDRDGS
jgi:hypothetical protein